MCPVRVAHAVGAPPLGVRGPEPLVFRLHLPNVGEVHGALRIVVGAEEDAIRVLRKEAAGGPWLATELPHARCKVYLYVGMAREEHGHRAEVVGKVEGVHGHETRLAVPVEHVLELLEHGLEPGRALAEERPVGRAPQLVLLIDRLVEGRGLGDVHEHRKAEPAGLGPKRIEAGVVDVVGRVALPHQTHTLVGQFPEACRSRPDILPELPNEPLRVVGCGDVLLREAREHHEAPRIGLRV